MTALTCPDATAQNNSTQRPKNIILMIGDGMGLSQVSAGMLANGNTLALERCRYIGLMKTLSLGKRITDSAAGATAFSIGKKTYNGAIGMNADTLPEKTIMESAAEHDIACGFVVTCSVVDGTPAAFYAHRSHRYQYDSIAIDLVGADVDFFIGAGYQYFAHRPDNRDLVKELQRNGYQVKMGLEAARKAEDGRLGVFTHLGQMPSLALGRDSNYLVQAVDLAINRLENNDKGFFLVVEGAQIDWGGHSNDKDYIISEMIDFDRGIGVALDYAEQDGNTLVVILADHETGG